MLKLWLKKIKSSIEIIKFSNKNMKNSLKSIKMYNSNKIEYLEYEILLLVHSIEKGLCYENMRYGFGKDKISRLILLINQYLNQNYDVNRYAFQEGLAALRKYYEIHNNVNYNLGNIESEIKSILNNVNSINVQAGAKRYKKEELEKGKNFDFNNFISCRHSIRKYSNVEVTEEQIKLAISMAQKAPSACNRQPSKVYFSLSSEKNALIDSIVPGNKGFKNQINKYLIITSDRAAFGTVELNQWYVNGGIFSAFLVLALHSLGIGSCIFQWADIEDNDEKIRKIAKIPNNEQVILIIGIGNYADEVNIPIGYRKDIKETISIF